MSTVQQAVSKHDTFLSEARKRIMGGYDWWRENHDNAHADLSLAYGDQWPEKDRQEREDADRPALNFNILPQFIHQVCGNLRQSKFSIRVMQTAGLNEPVPVFNSQTRIAPSEVMDGVIRDIEARSEASHEYVRAFQHAVEGGFGWLTLKVMRTPEDPFMEEIRIEHERDRWSCMLDPQARRGNFSDARWGAHMTVMDKTDFEMMYPNVSTSGGWGTGQEVSDEHRRFWGDEATVRVVDYYRRQDRKIDFVEYMHEATRERMVFEAEKVERIADDLVALGFARGRRQEFEVPRVTHSRLTATDVLDEEEDWPGLYIPLIPVLGREINTKDYRFYVGLLRWARDPQVMLNFWVSAITERIALSPKAPFIGAAEQINPYLDEWNEAHRSNKPVLLYDHVEGLPPPQRSGPAVMPAAEMQGVLLARQHVGDAIGMHDANVGRRTNEVSGKAIQEREEKGNTATFDYFDNLRYSLGYMGTVICDMIPHVYKNATVLRLLGEDGTTSQVGVNVEVTDQETGRTFHVADLSLGRYTCVADIGPEASTQRQALLQTLQEVGRSMPQFFMGIADLVVQAMDLPFKNSLARRLKMMVPRNLLTEKEAEGLPPPQPTPEQQAEMAKHEATIAKAQSDAAIAQAKVEEARLDVQRAEARRGEQVERSTNTLERESAREAEKTAKERENEEGDGDEVGDMTEEQLVSLIETTARKMVAEALAGR